MPMRAEGLQQGNIVLWMAHSTEESPEGSAPKRSDEDRSLRGRKILVVEDESIIAMLVEDSLDEAGAAVIGPCYTLSETMRLAGSEAIDAAVLDVDLSGQDVFPAAEELKRRGIPFVFHTAHAERSEIKARFGNVPVCRKPTGMPELIAELEKVLRATKLN